MQMVKLPAGKYVVAVSGGVDSMALLDMLRKQPELELVAAHVNHGIREDAGEDEMLTRLFCMSHNITYISKELDLGPGTSEEIARKARYEFLQHCRITQNATAIVTAHHQDDLAETVIINLLRGTGWRGLAPFTQQHVVRPLIGLTKKQLIAYAKQHKVPWREDVTNTDQAYLRNYVRHALGPRLSSGGRQKLLRLIRKQTTLRRTIEKELSEVAKKLALPQHDGTVVIRRHDLIMLPRQVAYELLQTVFRDLTGNTLLYGQAQAVLLFAKAARPGKRTPVATDWQARVTKTMFIVGKRPPMVS